MKLKLTDLTNHFWTGVAVAKDLLACVLIAVLIWGVLELRDGAKVLSGKLSTTLTLTNSTLQQVQSTTKSWKEELLSPDAIKAREQAQLATAAAANHLAYITLPKLDTVPDRFAAGVERFNQSNAALSRLLTETSNSLNNQLFPELTQTIKDTDQVMLNLVRISDRLGTDLATTAAAINELVVSGQATVGQVNKKLADPNLDKLVAEATTTVANIQGITANLNLASAELPPIMKTARRWQTPLNYARVLAILASVFKF